MKLYFFLISVIILHGDLKPQAVTYKEPHRPQYHFSPPAHWMNDPNGMVYYKGTYHLFYQYYPDSTVWGPMHWGHTTSSDMIHWKAEPVAIYPDSLGYIFSGSAVTDKLNTSGFQTGKEVPLVAIFTYHEPVKEKSGATNFQYQGIAYSLDKGSTWKKYEHNPVLKNTVPYKDFRDPKVFWYEPTQKWIMTLAVGNKVQFYQSANLKDWRLSGEFGKDAGSHGGVWECPDLFPLKVKNSNEEKWILLVSIGTGSINGGSGTQYFTGKFDGNTFVNDNDKKVVSWLDYGADNYAGVTWNNQPGPRRLFLGWMSNWQYAQVTPTFPWRSAMTLPRVLSLIRSGSSLKLSSLPIEELEGLRKNKIKIEQRKEVKLSSSIGELEIEFEKNSGLSEMFIKVYNDENEFVTVGFNNATNNFYIDRTHSGENNFYKEFSVKHSGPRFSGNKKIKMHLYIDRSSVELFADDGLTTMTDIFFPKRDYSNIMIGSKKGKMNSFKGVVYELSSVVSKK